MCSYVIGGPERHRRSHEHDHDDVELHHDAHCHGDSQKRLWDDGRLHAAAPACTRSLCAAELLPMSGLMALGTGHAPPDGGTGITMSFQERLFKNPISHKTDFGVHKICVLFLGDLI